MTNDNPTPSLLRRELAGILIIVAAVVVAVLFYVTRPRVDKRPPQTRAPLVGVRVLEGVDHTISVEAFGNVLPVTSVTFSPQVGGRVVATHPSFVPGGLVPAGEAVVTIDPEPYRLRLEEAKATLETAREELKLEKGQQEIARAEWELAGIPEGETENDDLATRGPQLRMREAAVRRAEVAVDAARLDLRRTRLSYPYPIEVEEVETGIGSLARLGNPLGRGYAVHALWVRASLPVEKLKWLRKGGLGTATILSESGEKVSGRIREVLSSVESRGSLGQVLVEVPLSQYEDGNFPVRVGEHVRVRLRGRELEGVVAIPRSAVHDGKRIWLADADDTLRIKSIEAIFSGRDALLVQAPDLAGRRLVVTHLEAPVNGMALRVDEALEAAPRDDEGMEASQAVTAP